MATEPMCGCHNPPARLAAHDDVADLAERITLRLLDSRGWSVNNPTRVQRLACERDARAVVWIALGCD